MLGLAILFVGIYLFPLYWMYATAIKNPGEIFRYPPTFWPAEPTFNFVRIFIDHSMGGYLWNSLVIAVGTTLVVSIFGTGCAYALARVRSPFHDAALFLILMLQ